MSVQSIPGFESAAVRRMRRRANAERRWSNVSLFVGLAIVSLAVTASLLAHWIGPYSAEQLDLAHRLQSPSFAHPLGTDEFGRDILSRVIVALRIDLLAILIVTYIPLAFGMLIGAISGYFRGTVDAFLMRVVDGVIAFPFLVLILVIVSVTGPGLVGFYIGVLVVGWAPYARITRADMLVLREQQFILATKALGYSTRRVLLRHAMPNLLRPNLVFLAGLSYLGLGVQPPQPELGALVAQGQDVLLQAWWVTTLPGLVIVVLGAAFSMIGDALGERLGTNFKLTV